jgi:glycosyltransferase involved in cell wall biosynthesis
LDPLVGSPKDILVSFQPPFHDAAYGNYKSLVGLLPRRDYRSVIFVPFCKLGGADFVAGLLSKCLSDVGRVLVIRTDASDWERPDWFSQSADVVDFSTELASVPSDVAARFLYEIVRELRPVEVYNVNSRLAFDTFDRFGQRLALLTRLYAYFFCFDRTESGLQVGYPASYFASILPHLEAALIDNDTLAQCLINRFGLHGNMRSKVRTIYTPASLSADGAALVHKQVASSISRDRPRIFWAGRFDRQTRFDLVVRAAELLPHLEFQCWGKPVLDAGPDLSLLPSNMFVFPAFKSLTSLPLVGCDGWLYTSEWDGLPTILIELGALGVPIVASDVGGVSELIGQDRGYLVDRFNDVEAYVAELQLMLKDPSERIVRAEKLQSLVRERHSFASYQAALHIAGGQQRG